MKELLEICDALKNLGDNPSALATVVHVEGSAYRKPGARMLLTPDGGSWGMVSGGCLEHDVLDHARHAMKTGETRVVRYDSTSDNDIIFGTGLGCNGVIDVFVEPVTTAFRESFIRAVETCRDTRQSAAIATVIDEQPKNGLTGRHAFLQNQQWTGDQELAALMGTHALENGETSSTESFHGPAKIFVQPLLPPIQLVIFGGWLDVVPLIQIAREIGFRIIVVDSRQSPSSRRFFAQADSVLLCSPTEALPRIQFDARTVAVLMNHNFERDQEALTAMVGVPVAYLGTLGPKRRQEKMLAAIKSGGTFVPDEFIQNLRGPVGLDLGAKTPAEIALSIMSEILAVLNGRNAAPIRNRTSPAPPASLATPALAHA
jgi:xanthine dehydrogenase accessory factor